MQNRVLSFMNQHDLTGDGAIRYIDLVSEVGELGKELLKAGSYGTLECRKNENMVEEMGDCLFSLLSLCCALDIDAETALNIALSKYQLRFEKRVRLGLTDEGLLGLHLSVRCHIPGTNFVKLDL